MRGSQSQLAPPVDSADDRRDSQRIPIQLLVREGTLGSYDPREGNLGIGGVYFTCGHPLAGSQVGLRFRVPGIRDEVEVLGEVVRVSQQGGAFGVHVRFSDLPLDVEMAIARQLEAVRP